MSCQYKWLIIKVTAVTTFTDTCYDWKQCVFFLSFPSRMYLGVFQSVSAVSLQCFQCGGGSGPAAVSEAGGARAGAATCNGNQRPLARRPGFPCLNTLCG